ncbi:uncharacterized protein BDR25DRAFT_247765 [Lindgomyces ingoldianus]|uniref:Uncharacterized protein n=1 Tax=Lindgomyces ingoldianus TaxID=673940 RepID=A0ACB6Q997_9PLEO|nr:uncharacterized protein BDR25DRAFT_247765 [Lindgomyces ingoldianus]KAF2462726.1 hypothetical protein BDR25DRAFT_247765 [Lindgomyces ingoldianus]
MLPILFLSFTIAATASEKCSRTFLNDATDAYLGAQSKGVYTSMFSFAENFTYTEQFKPANIASGILSKALKIDHNRSLLDTVLCTTFTEIIVTDPSHPYVIGTRMELDGQKITKMETLVTDEGDWLFNATGYAYYNSLEKWDPIPEDQRDSREVIKAAGDAYFNRFADANYTVPWGTPCARLEGGAYTGSRNLTANTCNLGLPSTIKVVDRRYVIDEELGAVDIYVGFPGLDRASKEPGPDSHLFRVEKGKLRYIHTISTCEGHPGCGLGNTTFVPGL